jgi:hypothetical protein
MNEREAPTLRRSEAIEIHGVHVDLDREMFRAIDARELWEHPYLKYARGREPAGDGNLR